MRFTVGVATTATRTSTGRTAWARNLAAPVRDFLNTETAGAAALLVATLAALAWANSPWWDSYESVWATELSVRLGGSGVSHDLRQWINEGLMTFYFLVVGLEAKRELDQGQLRERSRIAVPVAAALGGMAVPVAIYLALNGGTSTAHGWGTAMSTDTAFALGLLALVAPQGTRIRVRLLTLAVVDDLVALIVIATAYTEGVDLVPLLVAAGLFAMLFALRFAPPEWRGRVAVIVGVAVWVALLKSGIDPVIAGLAVGLITSSYPPARVDLERVTERARSFREQPTPQLARSAQQAVASAISPNERLQHRLHPWTSFVIVPLFALANGGIHVDGSLLGDAMASPVTLGIFFGYVLGKPLGITGATWIAQRSMPGRQALSWPVTTAGAMVAGVGFTVSLLIASIAFAGRDLDEAKVGVLASAVVSALLAWGATRLIARLPAPVRARQIAGTAEELVDLSDDVDPERDHIRGSAEAPVTLIEYGDFECPYCGEAEVTIQHLLDAFGNDLRYVWRHLPLNDVHPNAQVAAEAAEAAGAQDAFWEMHDRLLTHQDQLSPMQLGRHAEALGLDGARFWEDVHRHDHAGRIADDVASADASGVAGTPSFFINGRRHEGAYDAQSLTAAVKAAGRRARAQAQAAS
ncbi:MAG: Na+/H+ antiporter NhaA [Solirubrobacteraceae bacterium]